MHEKESKLHVCISNFMCRFLFLFIPNFLQFVYLCNYKSELKIILDGNNPK